METTGRVLAKITTSTLVHVMAWCHQAPSHYLNQCWPQLPSNAIMNMDSIKALFVTKICAWGSNPPYLFQKFQNCCLSFRHTYTIYRKFLGEKKLRILAWHFRNRCHIFGRCFRKLSGSWPIFSETRSSKLGPVDGYQYVWDVCIISCGWYALTAITMAHFV